MRSSKSPVKKWVGLASFPTQKIEKELSKKNKDFFSRFTPHEKKYCLRKKRAAESFAARAAAKMAFFDSVGISKPPLESLKKVEVLRKRPGPPLLNVHKDLLKKHAIPLGANILVSLTHEREFAMAALLIEAYE